MIAASRKPGQPTPAARAFYNLAMTFDRRAFLAAAAAPAALPFRLSAQESFQPLNRFPRMVQEWFVDRLRQAQAERLERLDALRTRADAEAYVADIRRRIQQCFGPFPAKTPLNPRITGTLERDGYKVEKILFESRPGMLVSANFYIPTDRPGPFPGVIGTCGHSANGKAIDTYQSFCQGLARQGYAVLIIDPIGQGERVQYDGRVRGGVREHLLGGNQQFLIGEFFGAWRAWDGIRALDYLLTREEVDPEHVGVTGNSGGGTETTWLAGLEPRWTMAAPSCFVTEFRRNLENELPADTEQCPPRAIALGLDHEDFMAAMAPKPVILLGKEKDYFDARGLEAALHRLKKIWRLLGAEERVSLFIGPTYHGYSQENREAMYGWFNRWTGASTGSAEPALTLEEEEDLHASQGGQVVNEGSKPMYSFTAETARAQVGGRKLTGPRLLEAVRETLKLPERKQPPYARILRNIPKRGYPAEHFTQYVLETEPGAHVVLTRLSDETLISRPSQDGRPAVLYVSHHSADQELREEPLVRELIDDNPDAVFYALDVRGVGDSRPNTAGYDSFLEPYGADYFYAIHSLMLDEPYVGRKTHDVLATLDWLARYAHFDVRLAALGWGTFPALFAAQFADSVSSVTLKGGLEAYLAVCESAMYDWPLSCFVPDVLRRYDLPDLRAALGKKLRVIDQKGAVLLRRRPRLPTRPPGRGPCL